MSNMREIFDKILVMGHFNPDTDAAASACGYAEFLNQIKRYDQKALGAVPGKLTPQTKFVFDRAGKSPPLNVADVSPRVGHSMTRKMVSLHPEDRVGVAIQQLVRHDLSMLPIIDNQNKLTGVFSNRADSSRFFWGFDPTSLWGTVLTVEDLISMPEMEQIGSVAPHEQPGGSFRVALDGDTSWVKDCATEDVLVCGGIHALDEIPPDHLPSTVITVSNVDYRGSQRLSRLNQAGSAVLQFRQSVTELLRGLSLQMRLGMLNLPIGPTVGELDLIEDVISIIEENHHSTPVMSDGGSLAGLISVSDTQLKRPVKVILVDHFEVPQAVRGLEKAEIIEIVDHHRVGDVQSNSPIRVDCRPVGSSCTIVATEFLQHAKLEQGTALMLLGGIVADTLVLKGPTTTSIDRAVATRLAEIAGVDLERFGTEVLVAGDDLVMSEPSTIWNRDQKEFSLQNQNFAVAQLETVSLESLSNDKLEAYQELVDADRTANNRLASLLVLTDVLEGNSWIYSSETKAAAGAVRTVYSGDEPRTGWVEAPGVVSRKKQIVPSVMAALAQAQ